MPSLPSLGLVMCVRDEEALLPANLAYHHALGVSRAYVFLDRCIDYSERIARGVPWVEAIPRDRQPDDMFMSSYQIDCLNIALDRARRDKIDWLLHLDADEFACGDERPAWWREIRWMLGGARAFRQAADLRALLARVAPATEQIVLRPREAIPLRLPRESPFWQLQFFQARGVLKRELLDPTTNTLRLLDMPLGHDKGKSIVRTAADVQAASAHRWARRAANSGAQPDLPTEQRGFHYHFVATDAAQWLAKHRKFSEYPSHWSKGAPVRFPKQAWKEISMRMSPSEARAYYARWVAVRRRHLLLPLLRGQVVYDPFVKMLLRQQATGAPVKR